MADKPIKLFASRAERYPEADDADRAAEAVRAALSMIPGIDKVIEFVSVFIEPSLVRRRVTWLKDLADDFDRFKAKCDPENLGKNEALISAMVQATRIAAATHQEEKRKMLRNALLNIAVGNAPDEDMQQVYLSAIEALTPSHVRVLEVLRSGDNELIEKHGRKPYELSKIGTYGNAIRILIPDLQGRDGLVRCIMSELRNREFSDVSGPDAAFPSGKVITNVGIEFLRFITEPEVTGVD